MCQRHVVTRNKESTIPHKISLQHKSKPLSSCRTCGRCNSKTKKQKEVAQGR